MTRPSLPPHLSEDALVLHYYGETEAVDRPHVEAHLAACEPCRDALERLGDVLALVSAHASQPAPDGFERVMWARVQSRLDDPPVGRTWATWRSWQRALLAGGSVAALLVAFAIGRWSTPPPAAEQPPAVAEVAPDRVLLVAAGDHLDRSQMVLVELLNSAEPPAVDGDRTRAADLVAANRLIRQSAEQAGEAGLAELLDELERVLLEIANGSDDTSSEALQLLKARIESRGILFRLRVVGAEVRERERDAATPRTRPTARAANGPTGART